MTRKRLKKTIPSRPLISIYLDHAREHPAGAGGGGGGGGGGCHIGVPNWNGVHVVPDQSCGS